MTKLVSDHLVGRLKVKMKLLIRRQNGRHRASFCRDRFLCCYSCMQHRLCALLDGYQHLMILILPRLAASRPIVYLDMRICFADTRWHPRSYLEQIILASCRTIRPEDIACTCSRSASTPMQPHSITTDSSCTVIWPRNEACIACRLGIAANPVSLPPSYLTYAALPGNAVVYCELPWLCGLSMFCLH